MMLIRNRIVLGALSLISFSLADAVEVLTEVKGAYFYANDSRFRDIYDQYGLYSLETSVQVWCTDLYVFGSAGYLYASGDSLIEPGVSEIANREKSSTNLNLVPLAVGLKYYFPLECYCISPYIGAGALFSYARIENNYPYVAEHLSHWGYGAIGKVGVLVDLSYCLFLDLFAEYSYMEIDFNEHHENVVNRRADLSGFNFGAGIGYRF